MQLKITKTAEKSIKKLNEPFIPLDDPMADEKKSIERAEREMADGEVADFNEINWNVD